MELGWFNQCHQWGTKEQRGGGEEAIGSEALRVVYFFNGPNRPGNTSRLFFTRSIIHGLTEPIIEIFNVSIDKQGLGLYDEREGF
jgi:hypothetical protein